MMILHTHFVNIFGSVLENLEANRSDVKQRFVHPFGKGIKISKKNFF